MKRPDKFANVEIAGYNVLCPVCGERLESPNTEIGRCLWTSEEVGGMPLVYCGNVGKCEQADSHNPLIVPVSVGMVVGARVLVS